MAAAELKLAPKSGAGMDRRIPHSPWSPAGWSVGVRLGVSAVVILTIVLVAVKLLVGTGERTLRMPLEQVTFAKAEQGVFHDLIPLRAKVVPRETVYIDAIDGGRVDKVLVEPGDRVEADQPMIELGNTNLHLQVIQQESQLNQAISQLQQNEIALEQNKLANDRALAEIDYNLVRLARSAERRGALVATGVAAREERDVIADELAYYERLKPIQIDSGQRQSDLRARLLPDIHDQLRMLRGNLHVVHGKLDGLIIRAPVAGRVTAIDLKVGEHRNPGQRLAEVTPDSGMKLSADVDEFYLARVRTGQTATVDLDGEPTTVTVRRVSPQVRDGHFTIDLEFEGESPPDLVSGKAAQGRLQLGDDTRATILPVGAFLERSGGDWVFVVAANGKTAERRRINVGRRSTEQLEILSGLAAGEQVITSDYTGLDHIDRVILSD